MGKVCVFLADGFEEIEGLTVVDLLRRAGQDVLTVSINDTLEVTGAHDIKVKADTVFAQADYKDADMLVLPGGGLGTDNLESCQPLKDLVTAFTQEGKKVAAICAAPRILGGLGLLKGKRATCYPSVMDKLTGAQATEDPVVSDGCITTSRGVGTAIDFGLELIAQLESEDKAREIAASIVYKKY